MPIFHLRRPDVSADALAADLSVAYQLPLENIGSYSSLRAGAKLANLGSYLNRTDYILPMDLTAGVALDTFLTDAHEITVGADWGYYFLPKEVRGFQMAVGAEYNLPVYRKITFGVLSSTRIKGAYTWTEGRVSANWTPLSWLDGGVNFAVNSFTASMGWVLNIHPKGYNFFIGMDHLLGKTSKEFVPLSSNASINLGMSITW